MKDILDALAELRVAFMGEQLDPPDRIILPRGEEGFRLISVLRQSPCWEMVAGDPRLGKPVEFPEGSGVFYMELELVGIKVCWPARRYMGPDNHSYFI